MINQVDASFKHLVFVDTNVLHYVGLYLQFAKAHSLVPFGTVEDDPDILIKAVYGGRSSTRQNVKKGRGYVNYLKTKTELGATIHYCPATRLELLCGRLLGKAIEDSAFDGLPRMWTRLDEFEIALRLTQESFRIARDQVHDIESLCLVAGVTITDCQPTGGVDASTWWRVAEELLSNVFFDLGDCIVYTSAAMCQADEIVSSDGYLLQVATGLKNPGGVTESLQPHFNRVSPIVISLIREAIGSSADDPIAVTLPTPVKVNA